MSEQLERLLDSLLYEGYALYPYTPGSAKNATPTPFGIVYPRAYAAGSASTHSDLRLRAVLDAPDGSLLDAEVRFLAVSGERHQAVPLRIEMQGVPLGPSAAPRRQEELVQRPALEPLRVALTLTSRSSGEGTHEVELAVENLTDCAHGADRRRALECSLISTHPVLRATDGRFRSPLDTAGGSVNTFPVLATEQDDALIGAAIVLPDHPQIAPESRGGLFDSTEIEEALLLHVLALSDGEREQISEQDPAVREMLARASAATPQDIVALHGRMTLSDPPPSPPQANRQAFTAAPPQEPRGLADPSQGEPEAEVDGVTFRRGGRVRIRPPAEADLHAGMLDGRTARIERILVAVDGRVHLGLTVDDDPGQELMSESGRFLFFFPDEVEVIA